MPKTVRAYTFTASGGQDRDQRCPNVLSLRVSRGWALELVNQLLAELDADHGLGECEAVMVGELKEDSDA